MNNQILHLISVAIADLTKALTLCDSKGATAQNAFCQRGLLYRKTDEDAAREDFKGAASLGSAFARNQVKRKGNGTENAYY